MTKLRPYFGRNHQASRFGGELDVRSEGGIRFERHLFVLTSPRPSGYLNLWNEASGPERLVRLHADASTVMPLPSPADIRRLPPRVAHSLAGLLLLTIHGAALGQTVYSPSPNPSVQSGVTTGPPVDIPQTNLTPVTPPATTYAPPPSTYGTFDPYAGAATGTTLGPPAGYGAPQSGNTSMFGVFTQPTTPAAPTGYGNQTVAPLDNPNVYGSPAFGTTSSTGIYGPPTSGFPSTAYPQSTPSSLFPEGYGGIYSGPLYNGQSAAAQAFRLLQGPRFRYTWVTRGDKPYHLGINDFDFSLAFAFPRFLSSTQPFFVIPSFSLHLWDGPDGATGADLPSKAYSAFLDLGWESDPNQIVATEIGVRLGVFTDFDTYNSKSFRVRGRALLSFRMTPTSVFKGGVYYVNRNEVKLVPAAGFFCRPNPFTRIDLYFPQPRYAKYCRTVGTYDMWWYLTGDYGGGNWTITRDEGYEDQVDINDLRAILGLEWAPAGILSSGGRRTAFAEIGYVFSRQVRYRYSPQDDFDPKDSFTFRLGFGY